MNAYADVTFLKGSSYLNIPTATTDYDTALRKLLEYASRQLDKECRRFFYCYTGTRYYNGAKSDLFLPDDLLSITTLKTDEDADGTFENSLATTDYFLYPLNDYPKIRVEINPNGDYSSFASGVLKSVEIVGTFGYGDGISATPYISAGTLGASVTTSTTVVTMSTGHSVAAGHTVLIDSEQMYTQSVATNTLTVKRGVNGAAAATHSTSATVNIYEYPAPITQGCLIKALRGFRRKA